MWVILQDHKSIKSRAGLFLIIIIIIIITIIIIIMRIRIRIRIIIIRRQNVFFFNRALHMKNKIATVLKMTKIKLIKKSNELRKFHT